MYAYPVRFAHHQVLRQLLVWVLVLALPVNSISNLLTQILGAAHRHSAVAPMLEDAPIIDSSSLLTEPAHDHPHGEAVPPHLHAHAHMMFERHFHQPSDDSVIALGSKKPGQDGPSHVTSMNDSAGMHGLHQALSGPVWMPVALRTGWARYAPVAWHSHVSAPPEHPPRH